MSEPLPKKSLGQHWLHDQQVLEAMCDGALVDAASNVLEIGPGLGTLTIKLLNRGARVTALEFDANLAATLTANCLRAARDEELDLDVTQLDVQEGDIRHFDFTTMPQDYRVCANIPYYLTSNLIRLLCDTPNKPLAVALLIQKEVAERIAAQDGKMSLMSCISHFYYECSLGEVVPARLFTPPPKVDSQILLLKRRDMQLYDVDTKQFFRLIRAGFSEKRKTLRNALSGGLSISKEKAESILIKSKIDPMRRAETLELREWKILYDNVDVLSK